MWYKVLIESEDGSIIPNVWHVKNCLQIDDSIAEFLDPNYLSIRGYWEIDENEANLSSWITYDVEYFMEVKYGL